MTESTAVLAETSDPSQRKRPFGVNVLVLLGVANLLTLSVILLLDPVIDPEGAIVQDALDALFVLLMAIPSGVGLFGLFFLKPWGWSLAMIVAGVNLAVLIWGALFGTPEYFVMLIQIASVFYLNQREVRLAFGKAPPLQ